MSNQISRYLLRPVSNSIDLDIGCVVPKKAKLFWAQSIHSKDLLDWPKYLFENGEKVYQVKTEQTRKVKAHLLDIY